jgi:glycine dehydrogenase subunit 1
VGTGYLALTDADKAAMLAAIGVGSVEELFADIPEQLRLKRELALAPAASEVEVERELAALAARNVPVGHELSFLGAGVYDHYVPATVAPS